MIYGRYAVYLVPQGELGARGAAWLGWDMDVGRALAQPQIGGLDIARLTRRPRRYGFHATIKPPMALAAGRSCEELIEAAGETARSLRPVTLGRLAVTRIGPFAALTPVGDTGPLISFAQTVVKTLDPFRAAPGEDALRRRRKKPLTPSQQENLIRWGYPHVMADFRFHITLTGPLQEAEKTLPLIAAHFAPALEDPFAVSALTLAGEAADGLFHTIARLPLGR